MGCGDAAEISDRCETSDAGARTAAKVVERLTHLLRDLHKQIAQRRVIFAVEQQMLTVSRDCPRETDRSSKTQRRSAAEILAETT